MDPELAQKCADSVLNTHLAANLLERWLHYEHPALETNVGGIPLKNPVGLAAGYDKKCVMLDSISSLGFGFVTGGTITKEPRYGNAKPRILRIKQSRSLINSLGFPNPGLIAASEHINRTSGDHSPRSPRVLSISGTNILDIVECHSGLEPSSTAIEINISSPNTSGLLMFRDLDNLSELIESINKHRKKPLFLKIGPFNVSKESDELEDMYSLIDLCIQKGISAITIANTRPVDHSRLAVGHGGLSGEPLFTEMIKMIKTIHPISGSKIDLIACGGISSGQHAYEALSSGAAAVQLLTSLVYEGPTLVRNIKKELVKLMQLQPVLT